MVSLRLLRLGEEGLIGFVLSHPSRKNKGAARMGHPVVWLREMGFCGFVVSHPFLCCKPTSANADLAIHFAAPADKGGNLLTSEMGSSIAPILFVDISRTPMRRNAPVFTGALISSLKRKPDLMNSAR